MKESRVAKSGEEGLLNLHRSLAQVRRSQPHGLTGCELRASHEADFAHTAFRTMHLEFYTLDSLLESGAHEEEATYSYSENMSKHKVSDKSKGRKGGMVTCFSRLRAKRGQANHRTPNFIN